MCTERGTRALETGWRFSAAVTGVCLYAHVHCMCISGYDGYDGLLLLQLLSCFGGV